MNVRPLSPKVVGLGDAKVNVQLLVAYLHANRLTVVDARRYRDLHLLSLLGDSLAVALATGVLDVHSSAVTVAAGGAHDEGTVGDGLHARAVAVRALYWLLVSLRSENEENVSKQCQPGKNKYSLCAVTFRTCVNDINLNVLLDALGGLIEAEAKFDLKWR